MFSWISRDKKCKDAESAQYKGKQIGKEGGQQEREQKGWEAKYRTRNGHEAER